MVNITHKHSSLRRALATAVVRVSKPETIDAVQRRLVPKGDVFEFARAAGLLAVKKTSDVIPDCHPLPIEFAGITYAIEGLEINISVEVHTIYKTGVEVEAMHGASVVALTIYDMLKPIDNEIEILHIRLQEKHGGKSSAQFPAEHELKTAVVVCSDSVSSGKKQDTAGKCIIEKLRSHQVSTNTYTVIPDNEKMIRDTAVELSQQQYDLIIFTGGTGMSPTDVTPEALAPLIDKQIPGLMEAARRYGQDRTPYAMLSRGVAGYISNTLVLALPGSAKGSSETMDALFPAILHLFAVTRGKQHE